MKAPLLTLAAALAALTLSAGAAADASHPRAPFMPTATASTDEHAGHGAAHGEHADEAPAQEHASGHGDHGDGGHPASEAPADEQAGHEQAGHGASHDRAEPAERPRSLVLGGFAGVNALVLAAAALVSRRDRRRRAAREAALAARSAS